MNHSLSQRGHTASQSVLRIDFEAYFEAVKNLYHKTGNPGGTFPLNVAENKLSWPMLKAHMEHLANKHPIPDWVASYTHSTGAPSFRDKVARFYSRFISHTDVDPGHLAISAGATSVIDLTAWLLGEPGDVVVFPAPCYPVYKQDVQNKPGLERYDLVTHHHLTELKNGPLLHTGHLDKAFKDIERQGKRFRILVVTNPDNPTGGMYSESKLNELTDWCLAHNVHLIVNEIYGLSLIDTHHPELIGDYPTPVRFHSFINIMQQRQSGYLHHWYALSKDFGASGFRVGMVYSLNKTFLEAYNNLNSPSMTSNYAQWMFELVFSDHGFIEKYLQNNQRLLTENYLVAVRQLRELGIPYAPATGSLFVWLDLSEFLEENTQGQETALWTALYNETGILLTPGNGFGHTRHGQFRLVHSCVTAGELEVAMQRLAQFVANRRKN